MDALLFLGVWFDDLPLQMEAIHPELCIRKAAVKSLRTELNDRARSQGSEPLGRERLARGLVLQLQSALDQTRNVCSLRLPEPGPTNACVISHESPFLHDPFRRANRLSEALMYVAQGLLKWVFLKPDLPEGFVCEAVPRPGTQCGSPSDGFWELNPEGIPLNMDTFFPINKNI